MRPRASRTLWLLGVPRPPAAMAVWHWRTAPCANGIQTLTRYFPEIYNNIFNKRFKASLFLVLFCTSLHWWKIIEPSKSGEKIKLSPESRREKELCPNIYTRPPAYLMVNALSPFYTSRNFAGNLLATWWQPIVAGDCQHIATRRQWSPGRCHYVATTLPSSSLVANAWQLFQTV